MTDSEQLQLINRANDRLDELQAMIRSIKKQVEERKLKSSETI